MYLMCSQKNGDYFPYTELTDFVIEYLIVHYAIETHVRYIYYKKFLSSGCQKFYTIKPYFFHCFTVHFAIQ